MTTSPDHIADYNDGLISRVRPVAWHVDAGRLAIIDRETGEVLDNWDATAVHPVPSRRGELRIGCTGKPSGARLICTTRDAIAAARRELPALGHHHRLEGMRQLKIVGGATLALAAVIGAYVIGVPLLAAQIVGLIPASVERDLGEAATAQIEATLSDSHGFTICDPDPQSLANRAIARFANEAVASSGTPFVPDIKVVKTDIPNAFALPGGHSYYFSELLKVTESPDEFAGVMAHELGHVVHRHGMQQLISTSATGLLIGFVLGDMTGLSVAGFVGSALIDNSFSRDAEREADRYAADVAARLGFDAAAMPRLLQRVAGDDDMNRALALFSTHPLTAEREATLAAISQPDVGRSPFTDEEWRAIKSMCGKL